MRSKNIPKWGSDKAVAFLDKMFPTLARHLVAIDLRGKVTARTFSAADPKEMRDWIEARQSNANLYFHVNALRTGFINKKAAKGDVSAARFLHVDVDDLGVKDRIINFSPRPTIVVFSGGGYHSYWRLKEPVEDLDRVEAVNKAIAKQVGGDNCHNIDRIMRLPGTVNIPNAKKQAAGRAPTVARVVEADWSRTYSLDDFPPTDELPQVNQTKTAADGVSIVPIDLEALPSAVLLVTRTLIENGDDPERPHDSSTPHFRSRSEVVFRVACDLARAGCSETTIAGVLINPSFGVSRSVLEKKNPEQYALKQVRSALAAISGGWPDPDKKDNPRPTMRNAAIALQRLDLSFALDLFRHRKVGNGTLLEEQQGEISDDACARLRGVIIQEFNFVFLDGLIWDGVPRLDRLLISCMGAEDTPLNEAIGRIMLLAAVRRVREPGVKFDTVVLLEGKQGTGKSTALQILAGPGNHSDNEILTLDTKGQMEAMEGVWIFELSEVSGLNRSEVHKTKAFASRGVDRARMAYGRYSEARPRQTIFVGTTNEYKYLKDRTGGRRFLPVRTGTIDLEALRRDRDQIWAEAAVREAQGEEITLPPELWEVAAVEQEERLEDDPWLERLAMVRGRASGDVVRASTSELLSEVLGIETSRQHSGHAKRLHELMRSLGWEQDKFKVAGKTIRGLSRPKPEGHVDDKIPFQFKQPF